MQNLVKALLFGPSPSPFVCVTSLPWNFLGPFFTRQRGRERCKGQGEKRGWQSFLSSSEHLLDANYVLV